MGAEEIVRGFAVKLVRDSEDGEHLGSVKHLEDRGVKIDYRWSGGKHHIIDLVSQFGGEGQQWKASMPWRGVALIFRRVCRWIRRRLWRRRSTRQRLRNDEVSAIFSSNHHGRA